MSTKTPNEVFIDGVRYVPATDALANTLAIKQGLAMSCWGGTTPDNVDEAWESMRVIVTDDWDRHSGRSIDSVLADIAKYAGEQ